MKVKRVTTTRTNSKSGREKAVAEVDSPLLFQKLIPIAEHSPESLETALSFELFGVPASFLTLVVTWSAKTSQQKLSRKTHLK